MVSSQGCLNCHSMKLENSFSVAAISDLAKGCLADSPAGSTVRFGLAAEERVALRLFLKEGRVAWPSEPCGVRAEAD